MIVLAIAGSLRERSTNASVLMAAALLAPSDMTVKRYVGLGRLPLFNPDLEGELLPDEVAQLRHLVGKSDSLLICSPEYARGVAGPLKNALDWLVGSLEFPGKPVAVINASQRSVDADAHLRLTLETMSAVVVTKASIMLPLLGTGYDAAKIVADEAFATPLRNAMLELKVAGSPKS